MIYNNCKTGFIYALYYNGKPFYIGQTKDKLENRFRKHFNDCFREKDKYVYNFIKSKTTKDMFFNDIKCKCIKICKLDDLDFEETKCIKYCIDRKICIYNNCVKTIRYIHSKYGIIIDEYNKDKNK